MKQLVYYFLSGLLLASCSNSPKQMEALFVSTDIQDAERDIELLSSESKLSGRAVEICDTIDLYVVRILKEYGLKRTDFAYWKDVEQLLDYKRVSQLLVGDYPPDPMRTDWSASNLKTSIEHFLSFKDPKKVAIFFPTYDGKFEDEREGAGYLTNWESKHFYHVPLGRAVLQLYKIKTKIIQLELVED